MGRQFTFIGLVGAMMASLGSSAGLLDKSLPAGNSPRQLYAPGDSLFGRYVGAPYSSKGTGRFPDAPNRRGDGFDRARIDAAKAKRERHALARFRNDARREAGIVRARTLLQGAP